MLKPVDSSNLELRFEMRDLSIRAMPEELEEGLPAIPAGCPICSNFLESFVDLTKICTLFKKSCVAGRTDVCVNGPSDPCKENTKGNCACNTILGHPTKEEPCGEKTKCNRNSVCGQTRQCGKCTRLPTDCHCTKDPETKGCKPEKGDSCKNSQPWCYTENTCEPGNNATNGCGCTKFLCTNDCTAACTNDKTEKQQVPPSPGSATGGTSNADLVLLLRNDLMDRLTAEGLQ
jgi:hypothetical protein